MLANAHNEWKFICKYTMYFFQLQTFDTHFHHMSLMSEIAINDICRWQMQKKAWSPNTTETVCWTSDIAMKGVFWKQCLASAMWQSDAVLAGTLAGTDFVRKERMGRRKIWEWQMWKYIYFLRNWFFPFAISSRKKWLEGKQKRKGTVLANLL